MVLTLTGDEEGEGVDGTRALLDWMAAQGERMDHCLVGEPTCPSVMGEMIKIGRRGSMTAHLTAYGQQGHSAYPERAKNPLPGAGAPARPPGRAPARRGHRAFRPLDARHHQRRHRQPRQQRDPRRGPRHRQPPLQRRHSSASLAAWIEEEADRVAAEFGVGIAARFQVSGESFLTAPGPFTELVARAVEAETGRRPELSTSGGTSDARFVKDHCPVVEVGLVGATMHQIDERVATADIHQLKAIYTRILARLFRRRPAGDVGGAGELPIRGSPKAEHITSAPRRSWSASASAASFTHRECHWPSMRPGRMRECTK